MSVLIMLLLAVLFVMLIGYLWEKSHRKTYPMPGGIAIDRFIEHQQEWILYHNEFSLCSKKIRLCLSELGIPYESREVDLIETGRYENISRKFLEVNPSGLVPVLVHNGYPIYESDQQLIYLTEHAVNPLKLMPTDKRKKELMDQWVEKTSMKGDNPIDDLAVSAANNIPGLTFPIFAAMIKHIPFIKIFEGILFHREKIRPMLFIGLKLLGLKHFYKLPILRTIMHDSQIGLDKHLCQFEKDLAKYPGPWLLGEQFSLADVGMVAILDRLKEGDWLPQFLTDQRPNLLNYWQQAQLRDSYKESIGNHQHPLVAMATRDISTAKENIKFNSALIAGVVEDSL